MLKKTRLAAIAALIMLLGTSLQVKGKDEVKRIYIYGMGTSFNDSTIYFTDIQAVDSAWLSSKNHFLVSCENYSYQLRDYLEQQGFEHATCAVSYSTNLKKLKKKWDKVHKRYTAVPKKKKKKTGAEGTDEQPQRWQIKTVGMENFTFQAVKPDNMSIVENDKPKDKKKRPKDAMREMKGGMPGGGPGGPGGGMPGGRPGGM